MSAIIPDAIEKPFRYLGDAGIWKRTGVVTLGAALIIIGIILFITTNKTVQKVAAPVVSAATKGVL